MKSTMIKSLICLIAAVAAFSLPTASFAQKGKASAPTSKTASGDAAGLDIILKKYVKQDKFAYAELVANKADLTTFNKFMAWQAQADVKAMSVPEQIAFYINAYNACCIKAILDHYPVHSPNDVPGFFDKLKFTIAGEDLTISGMEYDRLIANYKDMRAHFAVVCADRGCQPLKASAWTGATLDEDLEAAAKQFVSDKKYFFVDKENSEINISKIFEWYGEKFTKDPQRPAAKPELFLLPWLDGEAKALLQSGKYKVKIIEWDWTLNEALAKKTTK